MKEKETKTLPILLGILLVAIILVVGASYAIWQITLKQETTNVITTDCFKVEFQDRNPINLLNAYPIEDIEGMSLTPYEFTITNTCDTYASYQVNLEVINDTTLGGHEFIKSSLNRKEPKVLTKFEEVKVTLDNAINSYKLENDYLNPNETKEFELRLWLDQDTPLSDDYINKIFSSKITIISSYLNEKPKTSMEKNKEYILSNSDPETIIEDDGTSDHNLRYIGADPNNYIDIGDRDSDGNVILWRIVGIMNNVKNNIDDTQGESRIKLVRSSSIGSFSWDTSSTNTGYGVNEWSQADVMKLMNPGYEAESVGGSLYWNRGSGRCYAGKNNATTSCDFTNNGLSEKAKSYITEVVWSTGTHSKNSGNVNTASRAYSLERGDIGGKTCSKNSTVGRKQCIDTVDRTTKWKGFVGLIYASDWAFATSGGSTTSRAKCLSTYFDVWYQSSVSDCKNHDWLHNSSLSRWTIGPCGQESRATEVYCLDSRGISDGTYAAVAFDIYPSVFLNNRVLITSGNGSLEYPFELALN